MKNFALLLFSLINCMVSFGAFAENDVVLQQPTEITEAERCEAKLMEVHKKSLTDKLQLVVWDAQHIEAAIQNMKLAGEIKDAMSESRIRAQLTIGVMFASEGLLHEAVYQVFKARYGSNAEIKDALQNFKNISSMAEKRILLSEVIERVLQYIPDVDTGNVNKIKETASFVKMNEDQLETFRNKWIVYDQTDNFVELMQGGILAVLSTSTDHFVKDVLARGSFKYKLSGLFSSGIKIPVKPSVRNVDLTLRQTRIENQLYYETESLTEYLHNSSSAARRFFIMDRIEYLTMEQLQQAVDAKDALWLKDTLIARLNAEIKWRAVLKEKFGILENHRRDLHEIEVTIARLESRLPYDLNQFQKEISGLRNSQDINFVQKNAIEILNNYLEKCDSAQYINVISSVLNASNSRLQEADSKHALAIIDTVVRNVNSIGMITEHAVKVQRILTDLGSRLRGRGIGESNKIIDGLTTVTPKYAKLTLAQLKEELGKVSALVGASSDDLEAAYTRGPQLTSQNN